MGQLKNDARVFNEPEGSFLKPEMNENGPEIKTDASLAIGLNQIRRDLNLMQSESFE